MWYNFYFYAKILSESKLRTQSTTAIKAVHGFIKSFANQSKILKIHILEPNYVKDRLNNIFS